MSGALSAVCFFRAIKWHSFKTKTFTLEQAEHQIKMTVWFSVLIGIGFLFWGFTLYNYGDIGLKAHVAYYMSVTVIGTIVCLIHLPAAVWSITIIIVIPFVIFLTQLENPFLLR